MASRNAYCRCEDQSATPGLAICPRCGRLRAARPPGETGLRRILAVVVLTVAVLALWQWLGFAAPH